MTHLLFQVHDWSCALPSKDVREVMRLLPLSEIVGAPPFVLGLSILRGAATPVVDAGYLLHGRPGMRRRLISLNVKERVVLLAVDGVSGTRVLDGSVNKPPDPLIAEPMKAVECLRLLDNELLLLLSAGVIVDRTPLVEAPQT